MAEGGEDDEQKTEQPTQKRLDEAAKRGQVPFSREVTSFAMLFLLTITVAWHAPTMAYQARLLLLPFLEHPDLIDTDRAGLGRVMLHVLGGTVLILAVPLLVTMASAIASSVLQNGIRFTVDPLQPKLNKISPMQGFKRIVSVKSLVEFLKSLLKISLIGWVAWASVANELGPLRQLVDMTLIAMLLYLSKLAVKLLIWVCITMFFIALIDLVYQRFSYTKGLRMSKQELKEEYKQQEGDPHVKRRLKQLRMERARQRMMAEVPHADVVVTNPTHFAVALKYETGSMQAPKVTAKGMDNLALTMRKIAKENDVPVMENPPLARALYDSVEIDQEIPAVHYKAVAEIIGYVYRLKGKLPPEQPGGRRTKL